MAELVHKLDGVSSVFEQLARTWIVSEHRQRRLVSPDVYIAQSFRPVARKQCLELPQEEMRALDILYEGESWADVVRESQEVVELALKGLLRAYGVEPPRVHDVSALLLQERDRLPTSLHAQLPRLADISRDLRRDRELAFYGAEDLTPGAFYSRPDADRARAAARETVAAVEKHVHPPAG